MNSLERIERYANAQTPLVGIPYFSVADGRYRTAVFRRQHLEAALSAPVEHAKYDEATHHLVLNGGRSTYRLRDLAQPVQDNGGVGYYQHWQLRDELSKWAATKRKRVATAAMTSRRTRQEVMIAKWEAEIVRLTKQRDKIRPSRPFSPLLSRSKYEAGEWERNAAARWIAEKPIRRRLGRLVRRERKTWAAFYTEAAKIIGREDIPAANRHDRVCNRKGGPSQHEYALRLYKYVGGMREERPSSWEPWNPYKPYGWGENKNQFELHRIAQRKYCELVRECMSIDTTIANLRQEIAEAQAQGGGQ